ncbi:MAG: glycosyltransferase family 4 protein [Syntrophales bacterium]|nr:glycosyltransferase family 4 protein [Syntrophales bacterium]
MIKSIRANNFSGNVNVLFLPLYSMQGASSRYRVYNYADKLPSYGIKSKIMHPRNYTFLSKALYILSLPKALLWADVVVIQKKLFRGPIYKLIRTFNKTTIFDFDDALYVDESIINALSHVLRTSRHVIVGNRELENYARRFTDQVTRIPTPVDVKIFKPATRRLSSSNILTIGWIGAGGNQPYIQSLESVFERLYQYKGQSIQLKVISDRFFQFPKCRIPVINIPWSLTTELEELQSIDIGIMPLIDDELSRGKCAFKALQYMSVGVPTVASPVGMNCEVIRHKQNGLLASSEEEWTNTLLFLIENVETREHLGIEARKTVEQEYSYETTTPLLASILKSI